MLGLFSFSFRASKKASKLTKHPIKTPHQHKLSRGLASLPSLQENVAELCWADPLTNSVVQLFFLLRAYSRIPCQSSGERQTNTSVARLCPFILSQCFGPNNVFTITTRMKEKRWQEGISRWVAQALWFATWVEGKDRKKTRKGLRQKSPSEWLHLNQASPIQKSLQDSSNINKWIMCLGSKAFSTVLPKGLFHLHFL